MEFVINEIKDEIYERFIRYLYQKCNKLSFSVPDYTKFPPNQSEETNQRIMQKIKDLGEPHREDIETIVNKLTVELVEKAAGWGSFITLGGVYFDQYTVELNEKVVSVLLTKNDLEEWQYPNAPTQLDFFIDKEWYVTNPHAGMCFINTSDEKEIEYLKKEVGLKFYEYEGY